jgi:hypothetical protein
VVLYPQSTLDSPGQGRRSLDPEGVARAPDGGFFVCDEYGPRVYRFSALGQYEYELVPPEAYTPRIGPASSSYRQPVAEYIYQVTLEGNEAKNRNTGVSEILALSDTQFLVLEREGRGRGGDPLPVLYKRVIKADISAATSLLAIPGTPYDLEKGAPGQLSLPRASLPAGRRRRGGCGAPGDGRARPSEPFAASAAEVQRGAAIIKT